ncbi:Hypothetical protein I595_1318 [Croceitalea dokdonensis DOKDO 023]|uniref:Uncharacterized protein n=1 Tax=Croceitalea dokdonensis DOKDO 023 TaxID=1300341 RepID=A0A0P7B359_9FLAO|nr:Hypothetical protein I595_1318 [Croceitalea dokdonensis DOKDO 023]
MEEKSTRSDALSKRRRASSALRDANLSDSFTGNLGMNQKYDLYTYAVAWIFPAEAK